MLCRRCAHQTGSCPAAGSPPLAAARSKHHAADCPPAAALTAAYSNACQWSRQPELKGTGVGQHSSAPSPCAFLCQQPARLLSLARHTCLPYTCGTIFIACCPLHGWHDTALHQIQMFATATRAAQHAWLTHACILPWLACAAASAAADAAACDAAAALMPTRRAER